MSEKRVVVPQGMLDYVNGWFPDPPPAAVGAVLNLALRWLSENPIVPTHAQKVELLEWARKTQTGDPWITKSNDPGGIAEEWQRRMFLSSEPEEPGKRV